MSPSSSTAAQEAVVQTIRNRAPLGWRDRELTSDLLLGAGGLGLDSIALVELLIECEAAVGLPFPASLFDDGPLTVARLVNHATRLSS